VPQVGRRSIYAGAGRRRRRRPAAGSSRWRHLTTAQLGTSNKDHMNWINIFGYEVQTLAMRCAIRLDPFSGTLDLMLASQNSAARDDGDGGDWKLRRRRAERGDRRWAVWPRVEGVPRGKDSRTGRSAARDAVPREVWRGIDLVFCIMVGDHPILALPFSFGGLQFA